MNNNNFNVCPRCGTANSLVAHYCFMCGAELNADEQPISCGRCGTENSNKALFCKSCGAQLTKNNQTKLCPRCNNVVDINGKICTKCGYSFESAQLVTPAATLTKPDKKGKVRAVRPTPIGASKARLGGVISMFFTLVMMYLILMPNFIKIEALNFGLYYAMPEVTKVSGYQALMTIVSAILSNQMNSYISSLSADKWILLVVFIITLLSMVVNFFAGLIRLINGKLAKRRSGYSLFMFIISILAIGFLVLTQYSSAIAGACQEGDLFYNIFTAISSISTVFVTFGAYLIVVYYFVTYILSLIFRRPLKTQVMQIGRT